MNLTDRVFLATLATLALFVLFIERNRQVPRHVQEPSSERRLLSRMNIPDRRDADKTLSDVSYIDVSDAAEGPFS